MGGKAKAPKLPRPPDPATIIAAQAQANRVNQTTPFGNVNFSGPNRSNLEFSLSPEMQALFQAQSQFGTGAAQAGGQLLGQNQFQPVSAQDTSQLGQNLFDLGASRLQPQFAQTRSRLQNDLTNAGHAATGTDLAPGAVSELDLLGRQENDAFGNLALASSLAVPEFQGQLLRNDIEAQQQNINAPTALANASPLGVPQFNFQGATPVDVNGAFGIQQNAALGRAGIQQQGRSDLFGGLFDLGSAALGVPGFGGAIGRGVKGLFGK